MARLSGMSLVAKTMQKIVGKLNFVEGATDGTGEALEFEGETRYNYVKIPAIWVTLTM